MKNTIRFATATILALAMISSPAFSQARQGTQTRNNNTSNSQRSSVKSQQSSGSSSSQRTYSQPPKRSNNSSSTINTSRSTNNSSTVNTNRSNTNDKPVRNGSSSFGNTSRVGVSTNSNTSRTSNDQNYGNDNSSIRNSNSNKNNSISDPVVSRGSGTATTSKTGTAYDNHRAATINTTVKTNNASSSDSGFDNGLRQNNDNRQQDGNVVQLNNNNNQVVRSNSNITKNGLSSFTGKGTSNVNNTPADGGYQGRLNNGSGARANGSDFLSNDYKIRDHEVSRIPPRDRDFLSYDRPNHFYSAHDHYYGYRVNYLPPRYRRMSSFGIDYYYYSGVYYRHYNGFYVVCRPPFGTVADAIADAVLTAVNFAYYYNNYYSYNIMDANYRYIDEQNRMIAQNNAYLANQYQSMAVNQNMAQTSYILANKLGLIQSFAFVNQPYYYQDGVFYSYMNGRYTVIVPPAGALVSSLPDDYDIITMDNQSFYKVDDTVYRLTLISGVPYLEVLGQMYGNLSQRYNYYNSNNNNGNKNYNSYDDNNYNNLW